MKSLPSNFKLISKFITGSHLYGTNTPKSDIDIRGVFIPTNEYYLGFLNKISVVKIDDEEDTEYYELKKFLTLSLENNPTIIEFLFIPSNKIIQSSKEWDKILSHRKHFLSKKIKHTFLGYAISQIKRVKLHRRWLLNPPKKKPQRKDFGLPENHSLLQQDQIGAFNRIVSIYLEQIGKHHELKEQLIEMNKDVDYISMISQVMDFDYESVKKITPVSENFMIALEREKNYRRLLKEYNQYHIWKKNRNKERAKLEEKYGYDTKHISHCFRLLSEGEELLTNSKITFPRPDKDYLIEIKNGKYTFDEILTLLKDIENKFQILHDNSTLPKEPNRTSVNNLCIKLIQNSLSPRMENFLIS